MRLMTTEAQPRERKRTVLATLSALAAFWAMAVRLRLLRLFGVRGHAMTKALVDLEARLLALLFSGALEASPEYQAMTPEQQRAHRRGLIQSLILIRSKRVARHRARTVTGRGYRRKPVAMCQVRFERRIALRRTRLFGALRLGFVASTREELSGAPP
jgi:hypothetical protein